MGSRGTVETSAGNAERDDSHDDTPIGRRRTVQLAAITAAGVAGCTAVPFGTDDADGSGGDRGDDPSFEYTGWLYEPGRVRDVDHYRFRYLQPASIATYEEEFEASVYSRLARRVPVRYHGHRVRRGRPPARLRTGDRHRRLVRPGSRR